jgi:chromatin segregation and condensation protein Rec8/ScpA/Scc1 (kleisin family)
MIEVEIHGNAGPFVGPLDLLLAIVRRNGYPLDRLPLGEMTRQFTAYLQQSNEQSLELGSDFFETASWLVLLKSRALLPRPAESREVLPEEELRRALVAQERVQELGTFLGERLEAAGLGPGIRAEPGNPDISASDTTRPLQTPTVHDALASARRARAAARAHAQTGEDGMTVDEALRVLGARLAALTPGSVCSTGDWLGEMHSVETRCAFLFALLELTRLGRIWVFQSAPFAPVWVQGPTLTSPNPQSR